MRIKYIFQILRQQMLFKQTFLLTRKILFFAVLLFAYYD